MANVYPMTVADIMGQIHTAYEQAQPSDGPALSDEDGVIRINLINKGVGRWHKENSVRWRELFVPQALVGTLAAGTTSYPLSSITNFDKVAEFVVLTNGTSYQNVSLTSSDNSSQYRGTNLLISSYVTGNNSSGYTLNLSWTPKASESNIGYSIYLDYYKQPKKMVLAGDIPEMSDPLFLVDYAIAELFINDDQNLYTKFSSDALAKLANMRSENDMQPAYASNAVEDQGGWGGVAFGV